jgi:CheY-like chemotaxis protein
LVSEHGQRVLLRAEIAHAGKRVVTHTTEVGPHRLTFDWLAGPPAIGDDVTILLSFPRLVRPVSVSGRVAGVTVEAGHGKPTSISCEVIAASDEALDLLTEMGGQGAEPAPESQLDYRCLLVEDNNFIGDLFAYGVGKFAKSRGAKVSLAIARDAEEAWAMLMESKYDMVIVDYYLPSQNGSELIARMRAQPRYADMAVVAISVGGDEAREASMAAGADLFLDKPVVIRDLFTTLDRLAVRTGPR